MSLLIRAALLGGIAYAVSRAVRNSRQSLESSRSQPQRLARTPDDEVSNFQLGAEQPSTSSA